MGFFKKKAKKMRSFEDIVAQRDEGVAEEQRDDSCSEEAKPVDLRVEREQKKDEVVGPLSPLDCFFMRGDNTEKWLVNLAKCWHYVISFIWFLIGSLTFAPFIYLYHKSNVIFKNKARAFIGGIVIYAIIAVLVVLLFFR